MKSEIQSLAKILDTDDKTLYQIIEKPSSFYRSFPIKRTRKRPRWINAPDPTLKLIQRNILNKVLYKLTPHKAAHGFYPNKSIITNASPHCGKNWVYSFDIKDFFPSTKEKMIFETLRFRSQLTKTESKIISYLTTLDGELPQGAPTSPHLANLAFYYLDVELSRIAKENSLNYTRYADDMTFSGNKKIQNLEANITQIIKNSEYVLSEKKTKCMGKNSQQKVTGLVVNDRILLPRTLRRKIRAIKHAVRLDGVSNAIAHSNLVNSDSELRGYLTLERMLESA